MRLEPFPMPLFEWHPLEDEFDRRFRSVARWIERLWPRYKRSPAEDLVRTVFGDIEIYPFELLMGELVVEEIPDGYFERAPAYRYDYYIPYVGDDVLWNLAPRGLLKLPEGELFRRSLILALSCEREPAEEEARKELARINDVLVAQAREIEAFHGTLMSRIEALVRLAHRKGLQALPL